MHLVLKVLASLCDGQNTSVQDYLRDQWDNLKNIDVVGETASLLSLLYANISQSSVYLVTQLVDTLIEMVQGNEANQARIRMSCNAQKPPHNHSDISVPQVVVFDRKIIDYVNHILRLNLEASCNSEEVYTLKRSIGILLTDMTEENSPSGHTKMIMEAINKDELAQTMEESYAEVITL